MSYVGPPAQWDSKIPTHNKYGTILSPRQREMIAKKLGLCLMCGTETHNVRIFKRTPLCNTFVFKGICIGCNKIDVPADALLRYQQAKSQSSALSISMRPHGSENLSGSTGKFEIPGSFSDGAVRPSPQGTLAMVDMTGHTPGPTSADTKVEKTSTSEINSQAHMPAKEPELFNRPVFHEAAPRPIITVKEHNSIDHEEEVYLVRNSKTSAFQAYRRVPGKKPLPLGSMGDMVICIVLPRAQQGDQLFFEEPDPYNYRCVAIKRWRRSIVDMVVNEYGAQNPYNEVSIMQTYGKENRHIAECVEALIDSRYIYVVWNYCSFTKPLKKRISQEFEKLPRTITPGLTTRDVRQLFVKLLAIIEYLQESRICHRNLTPTSVAETYGTESYGHCRLHDLTTSLLVPHSKVGRHFMTPREASGSSQYTAPEIYLGKKPFDGFATDVWSMGTILFELLTGRQLCQMPSFNDRCFVHFVINRNLSNKEANLRTQEYLMDQQGSGTTDDLTLNVQAVLTLDDDARSLLQGMLELDPTERLTLLQVKQHAFLQ